MKCQIGKQQLQRALRVVDRIVPKKGGAPPQYAAYLRVVADEDGDEGAGRLLIRATNGDVVYALVLPVTEVETGDAAVPAEQLIAAVGAAPESTILLTRVNGTTEVRSGTAIWTLPDKTGVAPDMAPVPWPTSDPNAQNMIPFAPMAEAIDRVSYAAARTANRPSMMQLHFGGGRAVAADGRRLHQIEVEGAVEQFDIPVAIVDLLEDAMAADPSESEHVQVSIWDGFVGYEFGHTTLVAGSLAYQFADVDKLVLDIADKQEQIAEVPGTAIATAVRAAKVADDRVTFTFSRGQLAVQASSSRAVGRMTIAVDTEDVRGAWSADADLVLEALGRMSGETEAFAVPDEVQSGFLFWDTGTEKVAIAVERVI